MNHYGRRSGKKNVSELIFLIQCNLCIYLYIHIKLRKIFQSWCLLHQLIWCDESKWWYFFLCIHNLYTIYRRLQCRKEKCDQFRISLDIICRGIRTKSSEWNFVISWLSLQMNYRKYTVFGLKSKMTWRKYMNIRVCVCVLWWNCDGMRAGSNGFQLGPLNDYPI